MNPNPGSPRPPLSLPVERIRSKLIGILGADRWVEGRYHGVAPHSTAELRRLFQNYPGLITVVGTGSDFPSTYQPPPDTLLLFTARLRETFHHSLNGATLSLSAGYDIPFLTSTLEAANRAIPALQRFKNGSIGGRLAATTSRPSAGRLDGWMQSLLGLEVVTSEGELLSIGGRNIKDVAGYDMKYIFTGSRGALGVIVGAHFRTRLASDATSLAVPPPQPGAATQQISGLKRILDVKGRLRPGP